MGPFELRQIQGGGGSGSGGHVVMCNGTEWVDENRYAMWSGLASDAQRFLLKAMVSMFDMKLNCVCVLVPFDHKTAHCPIQQDFCKLYSLTVRQDLLYASMIMSLQRIPQNKRRRFCPSTWCLCLLTWSL